jgi:hypothetical protein
MDHAIPDMSPEKKEEEEEVKSSLMRETKDFHH